MVTYIPTIVDSKWYETRNSKAGFTGIRKRFNRGRYRLPTSEILRFYVKIRTLKRNADIPRTRRRQEKKTYVISTSIHH